MNIVLLTKRQCTNLNLE